MCFQMSFCYAIKIHLITSIILQFHQWSNVSKHENWELDDVDVCRLSNKRVFFWVYFFLYWISICTHCEFWIEFFSFYLIATISSTISTISSFSNKNQWPSVDVMKYQPSTSDKNSQLTFVWFPSLFFIIKNLEKWRKLD
jgi:hypothetical protein